MKPKVVPVDSKSQRQDRAIGDAPGLGRMAKVSDPERREKSLDQAPDYHPDRDDDDEAEPGEWLIKLGMISALLIGLLVGGWLIYYTAIRKLNAGLVTHSNVDEGSRSSYTPGLQENDDSLISEEDALDLVRRGLAVRFASNVTDHFIYTDTLEPTDVVEFLKGLSEKDGLVARMEWLEPIEKNGNHVAIVRVHSMADGAQNVRDAYLFKNPDGEWRIDYDSFASRSEPDWQRVFSADEQE